MLGCGLDTSCSAVCPGPKEPLPSVWPRTASTLRREERLVASWPLGERGVCISLFLLPWACLPSQLAALVSN